MLIMRPLRSEFVAAPLILVMLGTTVVSVFVAFSGFGWGVIQISTLLFVTMVTVATVGFGVAGAFTRLTAKRILVRNGQMLIEKGILGFPRRFNIQNGTLEMLRRHAHENLSDEPASCRLSVVEPSGNRVMLVEADFRDVKFAGNLMQFLSEVTAWRTGVSDVYEPPYRGDSSCG
jgi:hypothetical protein